MASTGTLTYGLSVGEVLGVSTLADARLIGGAAGVDRRIVQRLNVMEVPDILSWVKPHELLLTTGYPLRNTPQSLDRLVADLNDRGLAALAIKLGRYLDDLPPEMIEQADRLGFPLILLPNDVGFDDILNQVLTDILNRQAAILARTEEVHRALVQIVLGGGGLQEVADEVAGLLETAVLAVDGEGRPLAAAGPEAEVAACLDDSGRVITPLDGGHARGLGADKGLLGRPAGGPLGAAARPGGSFYDLTGTHAVVPVVAGGFDHGRIIAFSSNGTLRESDIGILERVATVAALVITKQQAVAAVESKYRADFLRDVLTGRAGDGDRVVAHCVGFGWDFDRPIAVLVAELDPETRRGDARADDARGARGDDRLAQDRLAAAWATAVRRRDRGAAVAAFSHEVVAVVGVPPDGELSGLVKDATAAFADHVSIRGTFSTGVSRTVTTPAELPDAYDQAVKAVRVGRQLHGLGAVAHFDQLGVYRLLSLVPDTQELRAFVRETLGELAGDADPEAVDLRRTLQVLLETNLNVAETARRLHFHYNTLRYRIGKLERLLGPFTEDAHLRLNLTLALHVLRMRGI
ncbi:MAG TPA: PucR family transcriptional regulator ligand-binding domain-containing protein [Streptosporangiaceae bacterium]|nr:PucR family transcriptional regulator ligand-binding domain-containing protein [Streptosporangiaceae bacterium]